MTPGVRRVVWIHATQTASTDRRVLNTQMYFPLCHPWRSGNVPNRRPATPGIIAPPPTRPEPPTRGRHHPEPNQHRPIPPPPTAPRAGRAAQATGAKPVSDTFSAPAILMKVPDKIVTLRLILRRHRIDDLEAFISFLAHPTATRYMAFTADQKTPAGARQMLEYVIASYETDEPVVSLSIADPTTDTYLGSCGLNPLPDENAYEIYYTILPVYQGQGLATEAIRAMIDFAFSEAGIDRVVAFVVPENIASVRVAEKLGFEDAGPVKRDAATGDLAHESLAGRRYELSRPTATETHSAN